MFRDLVFQIPENEEAMGNRDKEMFGFEDVKTMCDVQDGLRALGVELDITVFPSRYLDDHVLFLFFLTRYNLIVSEIFVY